MADKLSQVGKSLGQTKKNAEAALRRVQPIHPAMERIRDVFDDENPFEMEFETEHKTGSFHLDLYFNKPPPMSQCEDGQFEVNCQQFVFTPEEPGPHLINLGESYWSGTLQVYVDGVLLDVGQYSEYDPLNGLVYVIDQGVDIEITICYATNTWIYDCPEEVDPLNDTQNNTGTQTALFSGHFEEYFGDFILVDTNDTTQIPQGGSSSAAGFAEWSAFIADHSGFLIFEPEPGRIQDVTNSISNNGTLNFIPTHNILPYTGSNYNVLGLPIVDGNNVRCTFSLQTICGTNFGEQFTGLLGQGEPERINMDLEIGPLRIFIETDHDLRHPGNPIPFGPRLHVKIENSGDIDNNASPVPGGFQELGTFDATVPQPFVFNEPMFFTIDINMRENNIKILVNGTVFNFENPLFRSESIGGGGIRLQNYSRGTLATSWLAYTNIVQGSYFACIFNDVHLSPCGYHDPSDVT